MVGKVVSSEAVALPCNATATFDLAKQYYIPKGTFCEIFSNISEHVRNTLRASMEIHKSVEVHKFICESIYETCESLRTRKQHCIPKGTCSEYLQKSSNVYETLCEHLWKYINLWKYTTSYARAYMKHMKVCEQIRIRQFWKICGKLCEAESRYMRNHSRHHEGRQRFQEQNCSKSC